MSEEEMQHRLEEVHSYLGEAIRADEMGQAFELADELKELIRQAYDDERAAFISTHHGHDRGEQ